MVTAHATPTFSNDTRRDAWQVLLPAARAVRESANETPSIRRFAVLPTRRRPRWYLPIDSRQYAAGAAALYRPHRRPARVAASILRSAARLGALRLYPSRLNVDVPGVPALESLVADLTGCPDVRLAIYAGRGARTRATVLVAGISPRGELKAFARVAVSSDGDCQILREAKTLAKVNALQAPSPDLLWSGEVDGRQALVQRAVEGSHSVIHWTPAHDALLAQLVDGEARPLAESAVVARVRTETNTDPRLLHFSEMLDRAVAMLRKVSARPVINHRDFAPWNIIVGSKGNLAAIDWESAESDGLPHLDRLYFEFATGVLLDGWSANRLADYLIAWPSKSHANLTGHQATALLTVLLLERLLLWHAHGLDEEHVLVQGCLQALRRVAESEGLAA